MLKLGMSAPIRAEAAHLEEWLAYHRLVGVDKFWLFHNDSPGSADWTATRELLAPWQAAGRVELVPLEDFGPSRTDTPAHASRCDIFWLRYAALALEAARGQAEWLGVVDVDEYALPVSDPDLPTVLARFEGWPLCGGVAVNWALFGSAGHQKRQPLTTKAYRKRAVDSFAKHYKTKAFVRMAHVLCPMNGNHHFVHRPPYLNFTARGTLLGGGFGAASPEVNFDLLRINHYFVRSREDYAAKTRRTRWAESKESEPEAERDRFKRYDRNEVDDSLLWDRFGPALEARLAAGQPF